METRRLRRRPTPPPTKIGEVFGRQLGAVRAQLAIRAAARHLEEVAARVGGDLADPEQFRICRELAAA